MTSSNISNVTGCIQTKKGRANYYIVLSSYDDNGNRVRKWVYTDIPVKGDNKRRINKRLDETLTEYNGTGVDICKDIYFADYVSEWLENMKHSIESSTYDAYKLNVDNRIVPFFKPKKLRVKDVTPAHIQQFVKHCQKSVSSNTVHRYLANLSKRLNTAVRQNIIAFNPVSRIEKPKATKYTGAKFYNELQINELLNLSKGDPLEVVILLAVFYGLRRSEVLGLKWGAVNFADNEISIRHTVVFVANTIHRKDSTKNDSCNAVLPMPDIIKERLLQWKQQQEENRRLQPNDYVESDYICTHFNGELMKPSYVSSHFRILLRDKGLEPIRFHDLRHSSAGYLKYLGFDLKDIQTWLRHKDIQTTMNIYVKLDMAAKRGIADSLNDRLKNLGVK
jgi:integrase